MMRLQDSEEAVKSLLNATSDIACLVDTEGAVIAANTFLAQRLGREVDDLVGQNIFDLFPKDIADRRRLWAEKVVESGSPVRFEDTSADNRHFDSCIYPIPDGAGRVVRLAVYARDITEAKRASRALSDSEARFKQFFDSVNDGICVRDARTLELLEANRRFCEMYGYTLEELKVLPLGGLAGNESPDERRRRLDAHYAKVAEGVSRIFEVEGRRKDGSTFWVETNVRGITIGDRDCLLSVLRDITERRETEEALKRSEEAALLLAQETGVLAEIGRIISSSLDIEEVYAFFADEVRKLIPFDLILVNLANQQEGVMTTAYATGMEVTGRKKGAVVPITGSVTEQMIRTRAPMLFQPESIEEVQNRFPGLVPSFQAGLRSRLSVPLIVRGEVIGSLTVWSKQEKTYGERDIKLAQGVASQIAGAIANAQLFRERKRTQEALRESEESYRSLVETSPDAIFLHEKGRFVYVNPAAVRLFGAGSAEELYGEHAFDIIHPDDREAVRRRTQFIMTTGVPAPLKEMRIVRRDGSSVDIEATAGISYYRGKKVIQVIQRDITERKRAEEALRLSEEKYRSLVESSSDAIFMHTQQRTITSCNQAFLDLFGYEKEEVENRSVRLIHASDTSFDLYGQKAYPAIQKQGTFRGEWDFIRKDGTVVHVESVTSAVKGPDGAIRGFAGIIRDMSERKKAEQALKESEERYRLLFNSGNDAILVHGIRDDGGPATFIEANEVACKRLGYTREEMLTMSPADLDLPEYAAPAKKFMGELLAEKHVLFETVHRTKGGDEVPVEISAHLFGLGGEPTILSICRDITERKRSEERIRASLKEKEVLLKEIHHRVKNNLQIVSSLLFLQANQTEHPGAVWALRESRARVRSMALIHERLYQSPDLASVDMGKYTRSLVSDLRRSHIAEDSAVRLTLNLEDIPFGITEAIPCGLIINELVSNALKHAFPKGRGFHGLACGNLSSEHGEREEEAGYPGAPAKRVVGVALPPEGATRVPMVAGEITIQLQRGNTNRITLNVSDNGIGFPEQMDFRKSPSLGLTLVNSLVDQLDGVIELDRRGGTAFTITFKASG